MTARTATSARFEIGFAMVVAVTFFLVVLLQKPVYLYGRFFSILPILLAWTAAQGWGRIFSRGPTPQPLQAGTTLPA